MFREEGTDEATNSGIEKWSSECGARKSIPEIVSSPGRGDHHSKSMRGRFLNLPLFARSSYTQRGPSCAPKPDKRLLRGHSCGGHRCKTGWWKKWKRHDPARILARPRCAISRDETRRTQHARRTISGNADAGAGRYSDEAMTARQWRCENSPFVCGVTVLIPSCRQRRQATERCGAVSGETG